MLGAIVNRMHELIRTSNKLKGNDGKIIQNGRPYLFCQPLRVLHKNDREMQWLHLLIAALCCQLLRILQGTSTRSAPCTSRFSDSGVPALIL